MVPTCNSTKPDWVLLLCLFFCLFSFQFPILFFISFLIHQIHVFFSVSSFSLSSLFLYKREAFLFSMKAFHIVHYLQYVHFFITPPPITPGFLGPSVLAGASYLTCLSLTSNLLTVVGLGSTGFS